MSIKQSLGEKITIYIPTMNRPDFLARCFDYYSSAGFKGHFLIIDSSDGEKKVKTKGLCAEFEPNFGSLRYIYADKNDTTGHVTYLALIAGQEATTPYITFCADDDIQSTFFLENAQDALDQKSEYIGVRGERVAFYTGSGTPSGIIQRVNVVNYPPTDAPKSINRMENYVSCALSVQFSVFRTDIWTRAYSYLSPPYLRHFSEEFLPCLFLVGLGPILLIQTIGTVRQYDSAGGVWEKNAIIDLICSPNWPSVVKQMNDGVFDILQNTDQIQNKEATIIARELLWAYLSIQVPFRYNEQYKQVQTSNDLPRNPGLLSELRKYDDFRIFEQILRKGTQ